MNNDDRDKLLVKIGDAIDTLGGTVNIINTNVAVLTVSLTDHKEDHDKPLSDHKESHGRHIKWLIYILSGGSFVIGGLVALFNLLEG